jgi:hypothetical protein
MFVTMQYEKINSAKMTRKEHVRCSVLRILEYVAINSANKYQVLQYSTIDCILRSLTHTGCDIPTTISARKDTGISYRHAKPICILGEEHASKPAQPTENMSVSNNCPT